MTETDYLRTDERKDVIISLVVCNMCVIESTQNIGSWKWAILALHNAFQGALVCHLSGTAQIGALTEKSAREYLIWHDKVKNGEIKQIERGVDELGIRIYGYAPENQPPREKLADIKTLIKRLSDTDKRLECGAGGEVTIEHYQQTSFKKLHDLRNNLMHFTPKGWSIELGGLPEIFIDVLRLLEKIIADPWPFRHMEPNEISKLKEVLKNLILTLEKMRQELS